MPLHGNVLFEKEFSRTICFWFYWGWQNLYWRHWSFLFWQHQWGCEIVSLEADDVQITSFYFWDNGSFLPGLQWPTSQIVNPSGSKSKPIVTLVPSWRTSWSSQRQTDFAISSQNYGLLSGWQRPATKQSA